MLFVSSFHFIITGVFLKLNSVTRFKAASLNLILGILIFASIALEVISGTRAKSSWNFLSKLLNCFFLFFLCILIISLVISNFLFLPSVIIPNVDISIVGILEGFNLDGVIFDEREILIIGSIRSLLGTISLNLDGIMLVSLLGLRLGSLLGLRIKKIKGGLEPSEIKIFRLKPSRLIPSKLPSIKSSKLSSLKPSKLPSLKPSKLTSIIPSRFKDIVPSKLLIEPKIKISRIKLREAALKRVTEFSLRKIPVIIK